MARARVTRDMLHDAEPDGFPILDLADLNLANGGGRPGARERLGAELRHALEHVGFFTVVNHGVPQAMVDGMFAEAARFHALPMAAKTALAMGDGTTGYLPSDAYVIKTSTVADNRKPDLNAAFFIDRERAADDPEVLSGKPFRELNKWPEGLPGFRETALAYYARMEAFGRSLLPVFATALGLPPGWFDPAFEGAQCALRLSHYPPTGPDPDRFGIAPHTDANFLTVLPQSAVEGLYVRPAGRDWMKAPNLPGSFVVNTGDIFRRWTNDRFLSTEHLAINPTPDRPRYAIPLFYAPNTDWPIRCIPTCCGPDDPPRHPEITYAQYRTWFWRNNYQTTADRPAELPRP